MPAQIGSHFSCSLEFLEKNPFQIYWHWAHRSGHLISLYIIPPVSAASKLPTTNWHPKNSSQTITNPPKKNPWDWHVWYIHLPEKSTICSYAKLWSPAKGLVKYIYNPAKFKRDYRDYLQICRGRYIKYKHIPNTIHGSYGKPQPTTVGTTRHLPSTSTHLAFSGLSGRSFCCRGVCLLEIRNVAKIYGFTVQSNWSTCTDTYSALH